METKELENSLRALDQTVLALGQTIQNMRNTQKINDNATAKSKMEGISSKYGKSAMDRAATALDQNTAQGNDLMQMLDDAMRDADQAIEGVKGNL